MTGARRQAAITRPGFGVLPGQPLAQAAFEFPIGLDRTSFGLFDEVLRDPEFAKDVATLPGQAWTRVDHDSREAQ
jgi:hypothetical protein